MANRDVESIRSKKKFVALLRRVADAIENDDPVRIQVAAKRFLVPGHARLSVEHEVSGGVEELELQLKWQSAAEQAAKPKGKKRVTRVKRAKA